MAQPKSILKTTTTTTTTTNPSQEKADLHRTHLSIALAHAQKIQTQKETLSQILQSLTLLIDYPTSAPPSKAEIQSFKLHIQQFQPPDFDDLIGERVIDERCGYVLCGNVPRVLKLGESVAWKLPPGDGDFCSRGCSARSAWVRGQLSEVPAWERGMGETPRVQLWEERESEGRGGVARDGEVEMSEVERRRMNRAALAEERGEAVESFRPGQVMSEGVVEKARVVFREPAVGERSEYEGSARAIEGFEPKEVKTKQGPNGKGSADDEDSDADDDDLAEALFGSIDERGVGANKFSGSRNMVNVSDDEDIEEGEAWRDGFEALSINR